MEINDRILSNKILSKDRSSSHFKIILADSSQIQLWKVPKLAVYGAVFLLFFLVMISGLWLGNFQRNGITDVFVGLRKTVAKATSQPTSGLVKTISGSVQVKEVTTTWRNKDLIVSLFTTVPILEGGSNEIRASLLDSRGVLKESKLRAIWQAKQSLNRANNGSVVKVLIPQADLLKADLHSVQVRAFINNESRFELSLDLSNLKRSKVLDKKSLQARSAP